MKIAWNQITWYSKLAALILFCAVFFFGIYLGSRFPQITQDIFLTDKKPQYPKATATFNCSSSKNIKAQFYDNYVMLNLSDGRNMRLNQTISADGARYANKDETFIFWNKGNGAFVQEGSNQKMTYQNCVAQ